MAWKPSSSLKSATCRPSTFTKCPPGGNVSAGPTLTNCPESGASGIAYLRAPGVSIVSARWPPRRYTTFTATLTFNASSA